MEDFVGKTFKIILDTKNTFTVSVEKQTETHIMGTDKFGGPVMLKIENIVSMVPIGPVKI